MLLLRFEEVAQEDGWEVWRNELEPRYNNERELARLIDAASAQIRTRLSAVAKIRAAGQSVVGRVSSWTWTYEDLTVRFDPVVAQEAAGVLKPLHGALATALRAGRSGPPDGRVDGRSGMSASKPGR